MILFCATCQRTFAWAGSATNRLPLCGTCGKTLTIAEERSMFPMDPTANLTEQLKLAIRLQAWYDSDSPEEVDGVDVARLSELVLALHEWISKGGFLPTQWELRHHDKCNQEP